MRVLALAFGLLAGPALALDLTLPGAAVVRTETDPAGSVRLPEEPWVPGSVPSVAEGAITRQVLRLPGGARTTLQLLAGLRDTLEAAGYEQVFGCADAACGGFDFRFQLDILGEPDMYVDLGDYRYLLLRSDDESLQPRLVALLASRSQNAGFVHITAVSDSAPEALVPSDPIVTDTGQAGITIPPATDLVSALMEGGHTVLPGLDFGTGSSELGSGPFPSLEALASWLSTNPSARIVLVGHTDSVGSLEANTALSRQRATSVARFMVTGLGADPGQITAEGAGYLAPIASNLTEEGRAANRRVEVVLLSLD